MKQAYFVVGTDTGIGKTTISCWLLQSYAELGLKVVGMKPVASGCKYIDGTLYSDDALLLQSASNVEAPSYMLNPYAFEAAVAPHIAAEQNEIKIELPKIVEAFETLQQLSDVVIVEGVGGFLVPLNTQQDTADLAVALGLPLILVIGMRLGCINHALLTVEAIRQRGLKIAGWIANQIDPEMEAYQQNLDALSARIPAPCLAITGFQLNQAKHTRITLPDPKTS